MVSLALNILAFIFLACVGLFVLWLAGVILSGVFYGIYKVVTYPFILFVLFCEKIDNFFVGNKQQGSKEHSRTSYMKDGLPVAIKPRRSNT